jgi:excisionase family DNA binding protein
MSAQTKTQKRPAPAKLITIAAAAERYGVHHATVRRWIASGKIKGYKIGPRVVRVDPVEMEAALIRPLRLSDKT